MISIHISSRQCQNSRDSKDNKRNHNYFCFQLCSVQINQFKKTNRVTLVLKALIKTSSQNNDELNEDRVLNQLKDKWRKVHKRCESCSVLRRCLVECGSGYQKASVLE